MCHIFTGLLVKPVPQCAVEEYVPRKICNCIPDYTTSPPRGLLVFRVTVLRKKKRQSVFSPYLQDKESNFIFTLKKNMCRDLHFNTPMSSIDRTQEGQRIIRIYYPFATVDMATLRCGQGLPLLRAEGRKLKGKERISMQ